jgi:hypothetical protein
LNDVPREVIDALCHARPDLIDATAVVQHGFAYLALCSLLPHRAHKELPEYFSAHNDELQTRFGRDKFKALNAKHDVFEVVQAARPGLTDGYHPERRRPRGVRRRISRMIRSSDSRNS